MQTDFSPKILADEAWFVEYFRMATYNFIMSAEKSKNRLESSGKNINTSMYITIPRIFEN